MKCSEAEFGWNNAGTILCVWHSIKETELEKIKTVPKQKRPEEIPSI